MLATKMMDFIEQVQKSQKLADSFAPSKSLEGGINHHLRMVHLGHRLAFELDILQAMPRTAGGQDRACAWGDSE